MHTVLIRSALFAAIVAGLVQPVRADRSAIVKVLADMSRAATAADPDAYLAHVSQTDPIFYKEQANWAKDLKRKPPASVVFSIGPAPEDGPEAEFGGTRAAFELVTTWTMPESDAKPRRDRDVSFPVTFVLEGDRWKYAGEAWLVLEGGGANPEKPAAAKSDERSAEDAPEAAKKEPETPRPRDVRFQGPEPKKIDEAPKAAHDPAERMVRVKFFAGYEGVAQRIVSVLPEVRDHVDEGFGGRIARAQEVKIYPTMSHLQHSIYLSYSDGLAGWNEPGESIKILTRPSTGARALRSLLAHEYGHVATFELGPKANDMAWWILEGVAELAAERFVGNGSGKNAENLVLGWHKANKLSAWEHLADFHKIQDNAEHDLSSKVYKQGQHMLMYISETYGRERRIQWLREMAMGKSLDEASKSALGAPFAEIDAKWRASVAALAEKLAAQKAAKEPRSSDNEPAPKPKE